VRNGPEWRAVASETGLACILDMDVLDFADRDLEAIMAEDERTAEQIDAARPPFPSAPFGVRLGEAGVAGAGISRGAGGVAWPTSSSVLDVTAWSMWHGRPVSSLRSTGLPLAMDGKRSASRSVA
jgi:hypothetical protein